MHVRPQRVILNEAGVASGKTPARMLHSSSETMRPHKNCVKLLLLQCAILYFFMSRITRAFVGLLRSSRTADKTSASMETCVHANNITTPTTLQCIVLPAILQICDLLGQSGVAVVPWSSRPATCLLLLAKLQHTLLYENVESTGNPCSVGNSLAANHR